MVKARALISLLQCRCSGAERARAFRFRFLCAQLLADLLEESEEAAPGWVAALLAALVPPASPERGRVAAAVLQRAEQLLAPPVQARGCVHVFC